MDLAQVRPLTQKLIRNLEDVIVGKRHELDLVVVALLAQGHLLIEDVPGVGKTILARSLAQSLGYHDGLLSLAALKDVTDDELIRH